MRLPNRLLAVWRSRGPRGFARFIATRIFSHRRDLVFEANAASAGAELPWEGPHPIACICRENLDRALSPRLVEQLSRGEGAEYLEGLRRRDMLFVVQDEVGNVLHHSFVLFETRTKTLLDEARDTPLFAHCVTSPEARGQRLYPRTLRYGLEILAKKGYRRAVINCDPTNLASVRGIEHAGFQLSREIRTWVVGSRLGLQTGRSRDGKRLARVYIG